MDAHSILSKFKVRGKVGALWVFGFISVENATCNRCRLFRQKWNYLRLIWEYSCFFSSTADRGHVKLDMEKVEYNQSFSHSWAAMDKSDVSLFHNFYPAQGASIGCSGRHNSSTGSHGFNCSTVPTNDGSSANETGGFQTPQLVDDPYPDFSQARNDQCQIDILFCCAFKNLLAYSNWHFSIRANITLKNTGKIFLTWSLQTYVHTWFSNLHMNTWTPYLSLIAIMVMRIIAN